MMECFWANPCVWSLWKMYWYEMGYANNGKDEFNYIKWVYKMWECCCLAPSYEIFEVLFPRLYIQKAFENSNVYFQSFLSWRAIVTWICLCELIYKYSYNIRVTDHNHKYWDVLAIILYNSIWYFIRRLHVPSILIHVRERAYKQLTHRKICCCLIL